MSKKYQNILETIGQTPVVRINKLAPEGVNLYVKLEAFNPMGSVKDRLALGVIEDAERSGKLQSGQTVIEATSGNTGIGLAMVCAQKGYPLVVTMAENFSVERRKMMRFLGARVVLTPAAQKGTGMLAKAVELAEANGWFLCRQFENEANADIHSQTTAVEILEDFKGEKLDYWLSGYGTGGTLKGVARVLRAKSPDTQIIVCEPDNSPLLASGVLQQREADGAISESHPGFRPHLMQGWTPDFISQLTEDAMVDNLVDQVLAIDGAEALRLSKELAQKEGIFVGITAGATLSGALQICQSAKKGSNILCMLPDTGERYLSTPLFDDVKAEMSEEELAISTSTPGYRFDQTAPQPPSSQAKADGKSDKTDNSVAALDFVEAAVNDSSQPLLMFSLEWCEFCWSVRKMLAHCGIPYRSIDLDSVAYQKEGWGGDIRQALNKKTACVTIPQIFIAGEFVGGCTEVFDLFKSGELQERLKQANVSFDDSVKIDPYSFLPGWLQPR